MKKTFFLILGVLGILCMASCRSELPKDEDAGVGEEKGPELVISIGEEFTMGSRSAVTSSDNVQHIEDVYAYVFDGIGDDAVCIYEEDLDWNPQEVLDGPFRSRLKADLYSVTPKDYTLLVIGVDNNNDTYAFPYVDAEGHLKVANKGKTLSDIKLSLAGASDKMAYTEVFAGQQKFSSSDAVVNITLGRCIAGVLCYIKDIPAVKSGYDIVGLQLISETSQNTSLDLNAFLDGTETGTPVYGNSGEGAQDENKVLVECDLLDEWGAQKPGVADESSLLDIPARNDGSVATVAGSCLMGAYLLPIESTKLSIRLIGQKDDGSETPLTKEEGGVYGISLETQSSGYPLMANHIYCIGSKSFSASTDGDAPASLEGGRLLAKVVDWTEYDPEIEFPIVSLTATLRVDYNQDKYIMNCMGTEEMVISVADQGTTPRSWTLSVDYEENDDPIFVKYPTFKPAKEENWIFFYDESSGSWTTFLSGTGPLSSIKVRVNDFVRKRTWDTNTPDYPEMVAKDIRTAKLKLVTNGYETLPYTVALKQYNAITVKCNNSDKGEYYLGFSRLDYGSSFNKATGEAEASKTYEWGLWNPADIQYVYGGLTHSAGANNRKENDGYLTIFNTFNGWAIDYIVETAYEKWKNESALFFTTKDAIEDKSDLIDFDPYDKLKVEPKYQNFWFLPANVELYNFISLVVGQKLNCNLVDGGIYASCITAGVSPTAIKEDNHIDYQRCVSFLGNDCEVIIAKRKDNPFYYRQARNFLE